jgi:hypothetical protein
MSTVIEKAVEPAMNDGAKVAAAPEPAADRGFRVGYAVAPIAWAVAVAAFVYSRRRRRLRAEATARPTVDWNFSFLSGNSLAFRPTLAPRFEGARIGVRRRRMFRR